MKTAVVTGANGFVGKHLTLSLIWKLKNGYEFPGSIAVFFGSCRKNSFSDTIAFLG